MEEGRAYNHCLILDQKKACAVLVRRNRQAQETQQQTNATRQTHQNPKKKPQTTDTTSFSTSPEHQPHYTQTQRQTTHNRETFFASAMATTRWYGDVFGRWGRKEACRKGKRHSPCRCEIDLSVQRRLHLLHVFFRYNNKQQTRARACALRWKMIKP